MKLEQLKALQHVCYSEDDLKAGEWGNPRSFKFSVGSKIALVALVVVQDQKKLKWSASIRLQHKKKPTIKVAATWTQSERWAATRILRNELDGVGTETGNEEFDSKYAMHFNKPLTSEEISVVLRPQLLGN